MSHTFIKVRRQAGIASDVHLHSLRHFQATILAPVIPERQKQARMGWSTVRMARHYTDGRHRGRAGRRARRPGPRRHYGRRGRRPARRTIGTDGWRLVRRAMALASSEDALHRHTGNEDATIQPHHRQRKPIGDVGLIERRSVTAEEHRHLAHREQVRIPSVKS